MLARSTITQCSHRLRLTLSLLSQSRGPAWSRCCSSTVRLQSPSTFPPAKYQTPNPHDNDNDTEPLDPDSSTTTSNPSNITTPANLPPPSFPNLKTFQNHHNLPTFLAHASRTSLSPTSSTYIGTAYEYTVQDTLRRFGFSLQRTGGRGDGGIDLLGTWQLSTAVSTDTAKSTSLVATPPSLRALVQCKAFKTKLGPNLIRELEGAFAGAPSRWKTQNGEATKLETRGVIGVLVSPREATKGVREAMGRSRWPMVWVMLERAEGAGEGDGAGERVRQMLWNKAAREVGLEGLDVTVRYDQTLEGEDGVGKECILMWHGRPVLGLDNKQQEAKS